MARRNPGRGSDQFPLRLPDGMRDAIREAAEANGRSMNAEIIARLDESFMRSSGESSKPNIVVRLEALPPGSDPIEVSVASFLTSFDRALREAAAAANTPLREEKPFSRAPDGLKDPIEDFEGDE